MKLSKHNLNSSHLWTAKLGALRPIHIMEVLPRDKISFQAKSFVRFSPLVAPTMTNIFHYTHSWYIPSWLLDKNFEKFITGTPLPDGEVGIQKVNMNKHCVVGTLWDAFALPLWPGENKNPAFSVSAAPFRGFWLIWDVYYRDEDLQPDTAFDIMDKLIDKWVAGTASDDEIKKILKLPHVSWRKDVFTTARPWQEKGNGVSIPLDFDVHAVGEMKFKTNHDDREIGIIAQNSRQLGQPIISINGQIEPDWGLKYSSGLGVGNFGGLTINKLALASALARRRFKDGRIGSRYAELLNSFGANSADARLFIPQYLGGSKELMQISEVVQTSQSTTTSNLGDMGGHGIGMNSSRPFRRQYSEHGFQITLSFFRPDAVYMQGTDRFWFHEQREDYYFPEFENVGLQEIYNQELAPHAQKYSVFGWNDNYYYYRQAFSKVSGEFRTLDKHWHLARDFGDKVPVLNSSFVECKPSNRIFADLINDQLKVSTNFHIKAYRMVKKSARLKI